MGQVTREALRDYFPDGRWWASRVQPLPDCGVVFVKNAKAGTSTVMLWLHRIHTGDHNFTPASTIHRENELPTPDDVGTDTAARMLDGEAFRFSFVRDPITRVESAYVSKVVHPIDGMLGRRTRLQKVLGLPQDREAVPTFDQFVAALEVQEPIEMDQHWRPQHLNLMHPLVEYDLVGRLETFDTDFARVREAVELPEVPTEQLNATSREGSLFDSRPGLRRRVEEVYARDFELYGY